MNVMLLSAGFMMGLVGSPHCLGMCGGIVSAFGISMRDVSPTKRAWLVATYHTGRMLSYMTLGVAAATLGATVLAPFMDNNLPRVLFGAAIIFAALLMLGLPVLKNIEKIGLGFWQKLSPLRQKLFPLNTLPKSLFAGLLWGFLPCGLVYGAIGVALSTGANGMATNNLLTNVASGAVFMLAFGLGTLPMLVATQTVVGALQKLIQKFSLRKASGVLMLISGLFIAVPAMTHNHAHHDRSHAGHDTHAMHEMADETQTMPSAHEHHHDMQMIDSETSEHAHHHH